MRNSALTYIIVVATLLVVTSLADEEIIGKNLKTYEQSMILWYVKYIGEQNQI